LAPSPIAAAMFAFEERSLKCRRSDGVGEAPTPAPEAGALPKTSIVAMNLVSAIPGAVANAAVVLLVAPLCEGVLRKVTAVVQSRQGPPLRQPYFDLLKLLGKEDIESGESPRMQRFAAYLALAAVLTVACLVPMGFAAPMNGAGDVILLIYLLTLCGICTLLAGLAAGSTYSMIGISREMMMMIALEPLFAIALVIGAIHTQSFRLDDVLKGSVYSTAGFPWSGLIMLGVMLLSFQAFVQRVPFDISEAETEIMEGPLMEYSGPKLALFKYAQMGRLVVHSALFVTLFVPWGSGLVFPLGWLLFWVKVWVLVLLVTLVAATHARYRIDQALRYFAALLGVALVALVLASYGY
jgi:formate hydrogenlyase subunit 4